MADKDLFDEDKGKIDDIIDPTKVGDKPKDETTADQLLNSILNEDGTPKYKSVEEALKANLHAQQYIKTLEADNASLKDKGNASDKLDELMRTIKESKDSGKDDKNVSTMKPEDVLTIVKEYFDDTKAAETRDNNIKTVVNMFKDRYGKDASKELYDKADDLGLSKGEINSMIANNPNAALKVLGVDVNKMKKADPLAMKSGVDTAQFRGKPDTPAKSAMDYNTTAEMMDNWNASKQRTLKRLGIET